MKVLIDTNIIVDYISAREPFVEQADIIFDLCIDNRIDGCIAAHTITNLFYILKNDLSVANRKTTLLELCEMFTIIGLDSSKLIAGLENHEFHDFEDCLQHECALEFNADYLITRNISDYKDSTIQAIEPIEFLKLFKYDK